MTASIRPPASAARKKERASMSPAEKAAAKALAAETKAKNAMVADAAEAQGFEAIAAGDAEGLKTALQTLKSVKAKPFAKKMPWLRETFLTAAARMGRADMVEILLKGAWCVPDEIGAGGRTALGIACWLGHLDCVKILAKESNVLATDTRDSSALLLAAQKGDADCVRFLIPLCDPNRSNQNYATPLMAAVGEDAPEAAALLWPHWPKDGAKRWLPVFVAISSGQVKCAELFVADMDWESPVVPTSSKNNILEFLAAEAKETLKKGADARTERQKKCHAILETHAPLSAARKALKKVPPGFWPILTARAEAADLAALVVEEKDRNSNISAQARQPDLAAPAPAARVAERRL